MAFGEKLSFLMDMYRISNAKMARLLEVDPSLVSRWKSGDRLPAKNTQTEMRLGDIFVALPLLPQDRDVVKKTVGGNWDSELNIAESISAWLAYDEEYEQTSMLDQQRIVETENAITELPSLLRNKIEADGLKAPLNLWPYVKKGQPFDHEMFIGNEGKRQAAINFFHAVLDSIKPVKVYIMIRSREWIKEDKKFQKLWEDSLREMIRRGHTVYCINRIYDEGESIVDNLTSYVPMYLSERFFLYFDPREEAGEIAPDIFAAHGVMATISFCMSNVEGSQATFVYRGGTDIPQFELLFGQYLKKSIPLMTVYSDDMVKCATQIVDMATEQGKYITVKNSINPMWMPEGMLTKYLEMAVSPSGVYPRQKLFSLFREKFEQITLDNDWIEIMPKSVLNQLQGKDICAVSGFELYSNNGVEVSKQDLAVYIDNLCEIMRKNPRFNVVFTENCPENIYMTYKENTAVCMMDMDEDLKPSAIFLRENKFLESIYPYLNWLSAQGDVASSRQRLIAKLQTAADKLRCF